MDTVQETKRALALSTKRGFPLILAGLFFWIVAGICGYFLPESKISWVYIFGVALVFPVGILFSLVLKIDLFAKGNPLGVLGGIIGGMQILFAPIIIMLYFKSPEWIPFALGVLNGAHFLPYAWIYNSKTYLFQTIATTIVAAIIGSVFINQSFTTTPFAIAVVFLFCIFGLLIESKRDKSHR